MYDHPQHIRERKLYYDGPKPMPIETQAEQALQRVRRMFEARSTSDGLNVDQIRASLELPLNQQEQIAERFFLHGWLSWYAGDNEQAAQEFSQALEQSSSDELTGESAYWLARMRIRAGNLDAINEFETTLRQLGGSPRITCWFVDLLWRVGNFERAEQIWKAVRANRKAKQCEEYTLLEAKSLLHQGEYDKASDILENVSLNHGILQSERTLMLTWIAMESDKVEEARDYFIDGIYGLMPETVRDLWAEVLDVREGELSASEVLSNLSLQGTQQRWVEAQQARADGDLYRAKEILTTLNEYEPLKAFVLYARAAIEQSDLYASISSRRPGQFFAVRCRLHIAVRLYCHRNSGIEDVLTAIEQAERAGYQSRHLGPLKQFILQLQQNPTVESLWLSGDSNRRRAALERLIRQGSPDEQLRRLFTWSRDVVEESTTLREAIGTHLLRLLLIRTESEPTVEEVLWQAKRLLHDHAQIDAVRQLLSDRPLPSETSTESVAMQLWQLAHRLNEAKTAEQRRDCMNDLQPFLEQGRGRNLASMLADYEAQASGRVLPTPSPGYAPEMALHYASRAWFASEHSKAMEWATLVDQEQPELLSELSKLRQAQLLSQLLHFDDSHSRQSSFELVGFVEQLQTREDGRQIFELAQNHHWDEAREQLASLTLQEDLPEALAHHLAIAYHRAALAYESHGQLEFAADMWQLSWNAWLQKLPMVDEGVRDRVFNHLLDHHRQTVSRLLAQGQVDLARMYWSMVFTLPESMSHHLESFRETLAMEYLLSTREKMKSDDIPEGWRADYEAGLLHLRRFLSLDRDNRRLLTALVEICNDWFLDLYDNEDHSELKKQVERFTMFARQLAKMLTDDDLPAKTALAEFYKFRGYIAATIDERIALYREALEFNPANENVRELLSELEEQQ